MTAPELITAVEAAGGQVGLDGDRIKYRIPGNAGTLLRELRALKPEVIGLLKGRQVAPDIWLDVPCTCSEKPHPHFRHRDGSGPGSGHKLDWRTA